MIVCEREESLCVRDHNVRKVRACVTGWVSLIPECAALVWIWVCAYVCVWECGWKCQASGWGTAGWPAPRWRGWMDECEHLFHAPFTATGLIHLSAMPLSFRLSDVHTNHSHWWIILIPSTAMSVVISENVPLAVCTGAWEPPPRINVHLSTWVDVQPRLQLYSSLRQVVFFKNKCGKNKCRNVLSCCSCPLQMVLLCRRVPSSPCHLLFSPTNCLLSCFYLLPSFKRALIHT